MHAVSVFFIKICNSIWVVSQNNFVFSSINGSVWAWIWFSNLAFLEDLDWIAVGLKFPIARTTSPLKVLTKKKFTATLQDFRELSLLFLNNELCFQLLISLAMWLEDPLLVFCYCACGFLHGRPWNSCWIWYFLLLI